jgi:voltage-gated sodium channel
MASGEVLGWPSIWDELAAGALGEDAPVGVHTPPRLNLPNRRIRDPYVQWCGRGEAVRPLPIPIRRQIQIGQQVTRQSGRPRSRGGVWSRVRMSRRCRNDIGSGSPPTAGTRSHTIGFGDGRYYLGIHGQGTVNSSNTDLAPSLRERVRVFIESVRFERAITTLIVANAITLGLETSPPVVARFGDWLHVIDRTALGVFAVELLLRFFVYRSRFFHDPWRVFDFGIVGIALMPASGAFSVLRALRVLRVLRLVSLVPSMRGVVGALLTALPGMASIIGLMALVLYVSAVLATKLFREIAPEFFGSLSASLFALFQVMTVEGWPDIARGVMAQSPYAWIFFVVYLLIATFMVLNLFIAVVVNAMQSQVTEDIKGEGEAHTRLILDEVRALRREIEALRGPSKS